MRGFCQPPANVDAVAAEQTQTIHQPGMDAMAPLFVFDAGSALE